MTSSTLIDCNRLDWYAYLYGTSRDHIRQYSKSHDNDLRLGNTAVCAPGSIIRRLRRYLDDWNQQFLDKPS